MAARSKPPKVATYKGIDIFYNINNGYLFFQFEGDREVKYLFEAQKIIDEPRWEECDLKGFYLDHSLDWHIGKAVAKRKDTKSGRPDWKYKGKYDMDYRNPQSFGEDKTKVYPVTEKTIKIYKDWQEQQSVAYAEQRKANSLAESLKEEKPIQ